MQRFVIEQRPKMLCKHVFELRLKSLRFLFIKTNHQYQMFISKKGIHPFPSSEMKTLRIFSIRPNKTNNCTLFFFSMICFWIIQKNKWIWAVNAGKSYTDSNQLTITVWLTTLTISNFLDTLFSFVWFRKGEKRHIDTFE